MYFPPIDGIADPKTEPCLVTRSLFVGEQHRLSFPIISWHIYVENVLGRPVSLETVQVINEKLEAAKLSIRVGFCPCCDRIRSEFPDISWLQ